MTLNLLSAAAAYGILELVFGGSVGVIIVGILLIGALNLLTDAAIGVAIRHWVGRWHGS